MVQRIVSDLMQNMANPRDIWSSHGCNIVKFPVGAIHQVPGPYLRLVLGQPPSENLAYCIRPESAMSRFSVSTAGFTKVIIVSIGTF